MIIGGKRVCGKTTELIRVSNEVQIPIVVLDCHRKQYVKNRAKILNIDIPEPITIHDLMDCGKKVWNGKGILVDDVEDILSCLFRTTIIGMSSNQLFYEMSSLARDGKEYIPELKFRPRRIKNILKKYKK